ncbi:MAG: hypothetical protein HOC82_14670, partial [Bacteroidetes bacterium]|nr:hypothetical protein [Bacteroidota bacterium]
MQLYNLENDIVEQNNLYNTYPDKVFELTTLLEKYVYDGRSTPGLPQNNTGSPDIWRSLQVRNVKYDTTMTNHLAVGKQVQLKHDTPLKFTNNGLDILTDGIRASSWYNDGYWLGVEGEDLEIILDLGKEIVVNSISAGFLEAQAYWIFHPQSIAFSTSSNGIDFSNEKILKRSAITQNDERVIKDFSIDIENIKCRYLRIKAEGVKVCPEWHKGAGGKAWMLIDEIIIE